MVSHGPRPKLSPRHPVHVTLRLLRSVGSLRSDRAFHVVLRAFASSAARFCMRLIHYSVQGNHIHLIVEAAGKLSLTKGMQGLAIRIAKRLNKLLGRNGHVFSDRYHEHILATPAEVRNALAYVLNNARRHARQLGKTLPGAWLDPCSSSRAFDGWSDPLPPARAPAPQPPVLAAGTWLITDGWRRHGPIPINEVPGPRA